MMASSSTIVNVNSKRTNTKENPSKTDADIPKHALFPNTLYSWFIQFLLLIGIILALFSVLIYEAPWKIATNSPSNTCLHPAWNNINYKYTVLMSSFTLGPVFICRFLFLLGFIASILSTFGFKIEIPEQLSDQWLKIIITVVFTLAILVVISVVTAACFAILTVGKTASPVLLPDGKLLECDQPIANYYNKMRLPYLFPSFALLAAMVILLIFSFILWDAVRAIGGPVGKDSSTTRAANRPLDLPV